CMDVVGKVVALQDKNMKITNTLHYCANHLKDCPYFAIKCSPEQIQNIINLALAVLTSKKHIAISHIDENEKENSISTISTHSSGSFLKKQSTLFQYIGQHLNASEVPNNRILINATNEVQTTIKDLACNDKIGITIAFDGWHNVVNQELMGIVFITSSEETLIWGAEDISIERQRKEEVIIRIRNLFEETLVTKDDAALNNDLTLPSKIKVTVNHDSFWESLIMLYNLLHPFCKALDLMQCDKAHLHNVLYSFGFIMQIFKELELHANILQTYKKKFNIQLHYFSSSINSVPIVSSSINSVPIASTSEETDNNDNGDEDSSLEADWDVEEFEEEQDDFDEVDIDFLSSEIYSAENQAVKWELQNLFLSNLPFSFKNI
ncbi:11930_t:CDS:2, partial [Gigaspora margarita]